MTTNRDRDSYLSSKRVQSYRYGNQVCVGARGRALMVWLRLHFLFDCRAWTHPHTGKS